MKRILSAVLLLLLVRPAFAADKWVSVHSRHFLLAGNASESEIRRVGRYFEEFRGVLASLFPKIELVSAPATIVVLKTEDLFKPAYQPGDDTNYIVVTKSAAPPALLHEYVHLLTRFAAGNLPLWVSEGLAEYYSTFEAGGRENEFAVGRAIGPHISVLNGNQLIPLGDLFDLDHTSSFYDEKTKQGLLYAESWALVHYLLGSEGKRRPQFVQFLSQLGGDKLADETFHLTFQADLSTIDKELRDYLRARATWPVAKVASREGLQVERSMTSNQLSEAQAEYYMGDLLFHTNRLPEAETHLKNAISLDAKLWAAHASLGMVYMRQKKYQEAVDLLTKAAEADSRNALVNYQYASSLQRVDDEGLPVTTVSASSATRYDDIRAHLKKSIDLDPRFVEAYALLSTANLSAGEHLDEAELLLQKAIAIAPGRHDLVLLLAQIMLREDKTAQARTLLTNISRNSDDPDARGRAGSILDQLNSRRSTFTEIPSEPARPVETPTNNTPAPPRAPNQRETIIEAVTPIGPSVEGEKVSGMLILLDCTNGLLLRVRTDKGSMDFHTSTPDKIQFLSYTAEVTDNIKCGPRNPGSPVAITYRPNRGGPGEPLVVEFLEKK